MKTYNVAVQSSGVNADFIDDVIVVATDEPEAEELAAEQIVEEFPSRVVIDSTAVVLYLRQARVIGRIANGEILAPSKAPAPDLGAFAFGNAGMPPDED